MREHKKKIILTSVLTLIPMFAGLLLWSRLPDKMVTHWGVDNVPNGWSSKTFTVLGMPVILVAVHLLGITVTLNDPKKQNIGKKMIGLMFWIVPAISCITGLATYGYALHIPVNMEVIVQVLVGIIFVVIGNYMSKNRQNYTVGIKIPWTLNNQENWNRTHHMASRLYIAGGLAFILNIFLSCAPVLFIILVVVTLAPVVYSFILYKKGI